MTTDTLTTRFTLRRTPGRRWELLDGDDVVSTFTKRADAEAELAASIADVTPAVNEASPETVAEITNAIAAAVTDDPASFAGVVTVENIAAMDPATRLAFARAERDALQAAKAARTPMPATPVLDWMLDPSTGLAAQPKAKSTGSRAVPRSAEDEQILKDAIVAARSGGATWHAVGKALHAAGIDTPRGGRWYAVTVRETAKRLGVYDGTDGVLETE